jgi:uncharacterized glyoxalase superfamily protein PhnB
MASQVTSAFLYVNDIVKSYEFYHEIVGFEIGQIHKAEETGPITLALLRVGGFTLMIHPQEEHAADFVNNKPGIGIHLQLRVDDIDAFHQHCLDEGAILAVSGEPIDQPWGWREFALKDPDGYVWSIYEDKSGGKWT